MPKGYWWQCEQCGAVRSFPDATNSNSVAAFIWDELVPADWDQSLLVQSCRQCKGDTLRITYHFPRHDRVLLQVHHIIGHPPDEGKYVPMMWASEPSYDRDNLRIDFKYIVGRNPLGLSRPAVFTHESFRSLLTKYRELTGIELAS